MTGAAEVQDRLATFKQAMEQLSAIGNIRVLVTGEMVSTAMAPRAGFEPATIRLTVVNYFISPHCTAFHMCSEVPCFIDFL
jgi:hypothetical protein